MKVRGVGFNRMFFNLWFRIAPMAATKRLNFKLGVAEALNDIVRDESGGLSDMEVCVLLGLLLVILALFSCSFLPSWPPR